MPADLKKYIRSIRDFPIKGVMFRDITTLLKEPVALKETLNQLLRFTEGYKIDKVVGIESRGFIFGAMLANELNTGFVPIRKTGKLPAEIEFQTYQLEYGLDKIEIHKDAINPGDKVLIHDDLLATGGTAEACAELICKVGGKVVEMDFLIELSFLKGRDKLKGFSVFAPIVF